MDEFAEEILKIMRPGRKVANAQQGYLSTDFIKEKTKDKPKCEKRRILKCWENIFQSWRNLEEIVVPYASELFEIVLEGNPIIYKGVSYNPRVLSFGENTNLLDFFSWLKEGGFKGIVLDASLYAIINAMQQNLVELYSKNAASEAVDFIKNNVQKFYDIKESARIRGNYLRAISISLFSASSQPLVIDAEMMWKSKHYIDCLQKAIDFCSENPNPGTPLIIRKYANYIRYDTPYQRWYSVFVLAEALYLYKVYGVNVKLGPTTESNFDSLIREFMKSLGINYGFIWYNRSIEKEFSYPELIFFNDSPLTIAKKLENKRMQEWFLEILRPFSKNQKFLSEELATIVKKVNEVASKSLKKLEVEGSWYLTFPPGACD